MQLTQFKYNIKSDAFVDLYGNILRKCSKCNQLKDHERFKGGTMCNTCIYLSAKEKGGERYLQKINRAVRKNYATKNVNNPTKEQREKQYYSNHDGKHCKVYFLKCLITDKLFTSNKFSNKPFTIKIKGDYKTTISLVNAIKLRGRYHNCSQCNNDIDLTIKGKIFTEYVFCSNNCRIEYTKETKVNSRHRRRIRKMSNHERVSRTKVFNNDNYTCYLCGIKVVVYKNINDIRKQKDSATLDHVIPLAKGGSHSYANIRTCCSWCNSNKSDKVLEGTTPPIR